MDQTGLSPKAEDALQKLQDTKLDPMEEQLFGAWTKANQIEDPDVEGDVVDYRGIWKTTNGKVLPYGELKKLANEKNASHTLERALQERMVKRMSEITGHKEDMEKNRFQAEQKGLDHDRKMEHGQLKLEEGKFKLQQGEQKLKHAPFEMQKAELDLEKQKLGLQGQELGIKAKKTDLISSMLNPAGPTGVNQNERHSSGGAERD